MLCSAQPLSWGGSVMLCAPNCLFWLCWVLNSTPLRLILRVREGKEAVLSLFS